MVLHHKPRRPRRKPPENSVIRRSVERDLQAARAQDREIKISSGTIDFVSYDKSPIKTEMCTTNDQGEQVCRTRSMLVLFQRVWAYEWTAIGRHDGRGRSAAASSAASDVLWMTIARIKNLRVLYHLRRDGELRPQTGSGPVRPQQRKTPIRSLGLPGSDLPCETNPGRSWTTGLERRL